MNFIELAEAFYAACCKAEDGAPEAVAGALRCTRDEVLLLLDTIVAEMQRVDYRPR